MTRQCRVGQRRSLRSGRCSARPRYRRHGPRPDDTRALCKGHRALTEDTTVAVTKVPVAATSRDLQFGNMALVYTSYTPGLDPGPARPTRWCQTLIVPIIPQEVARGSIA